MTCPDPQKCIFFYGHSKGNHPYMSNFFRCKLTMTHECIGKSCDVHTYPTSEHAIMHIKACLMGDEDTADAILSTEKPLAAKRLGRKVKPWDEKKWLDHVEAIAEAVVYAKFVQNEPLARKLKDTGDKYLAEAAPRDKNWGIGMGAKKAMDGEKWKGRNLLGVSLMKARAHM